MSGASRLTAILGRALWTRPGVGAALQSPLPLDRRHLATPLSGGHRWLPRGRHSSASDQEPPSLKDSLRKLYMRVHPDLFNNHPREQEVNQRSFQLLQEYLEAAKRAPDGPGKLFRFEFYLHASEGDRVVPEEEPRELRRVEVALPPPSRNPGLEGGLSRPAQMALGKLLAACGLSPEFAGGGGGCDVQGMGLTEFIRGAIDELRRRQALQKSSDSQLAFARTALRVGRGVVVSYGPAAGAQTPEAKLQLVQKLAGALDQAEGVELAGCTVVLGDRFGVDATGKVWVDAAEGTREHIADELRSLDLRQVAAGLEAVRRKEAAEQRVADRMGVGMVYTDGTMAMGADYADFLRRASAFAEERGEVAGGRMQDLAVRVTAGRAGGGTGCAVDEEHGCVTIPVDASPDEVWGFIGAEGEGAMAIRVRLQQEEDSFEALKVRKALRLRHLVKAEGVPPDRFKLCCTRLLQHAPMLQPLTDGLPLRVAERHNVTADGAFIEIRWDYTLE